MSNKNRTDQRTILIDLESGYKNNLCGKDLATTNAPQILLNNISDAVKNLNQSITGTAEGDFIHLVKKNGYEIEVLVSLDELEIISASNNNF